ncbi:MAG: tryptophan 7-halogenase [Crocinitomicaceae bacterium]
MEQVKTDITIIGGGIAGCIAAISLADKFNVTLVDKLLEPRERIGESLTPAAHRILRELNLLDALESLQGEVFLKNMGMQSYWGSDQVHFVDHLRNPDGFVKSLNRKAFEQFLREATEKRGVECLWNTKMLSSNRDKHWEITLQTADEAPFSIESNFVIDASGRQAHFARSLGVKREVEDKLIACWMSLPNTFENTMSTISSGATGWWYSAVIPNNQRVVAFHTDSDLIEKNKLKSAESLLELAQTNTEIAQILDESEDVQFHGTVAANSTRLTHVCGDHWAALGDAALSFDPLSSQGMFNAMASAMQLRDLILKFGFSEDLQTIYSGQTDRIWQQYLQHKSIFYQAEQRWKEESFWKRRLGN